MVPDKSSELATSNLKENCPYAKNCGCEDIKVCYENYERCTIYQRNKAINKRVGNIDTKTISRIEKIVE